MSSSPATVQKMTNPKKDKRRKITRTAVERTIYIVLIVVLAIYGLKDSQAAVSLINAIQGAFSILLNYQP